MARRVYGSRNNYYNTDPNNFWVQSKDVIDNFLDTWGTTNKIFADSERYTQDVLNTQMMRANMPYQMGQLQQNMQAQQVQSNLYNAMLAGQISPEDYALGMQTFGMSPQMRAQNAMSQFNADRNYNLQVAKLLDDRKLQMQYMKMQEQAARQAAKAGNNASGLPTVDVKTLNDMYKWNVERGMPEGEAFSAAQLMAAGINPADAKARGAAHQAKVSEAEKNLKNLQDLRAQELARSKYSSKAPSATTPSTNVSPFDSPALLNPYENVGVD